MSKITIIRLVLSLVLAINTILTRAETIIAPSAATNCQRTKVNNKTTMPELRAVPTISSLEDFQSLLPNYLSANKQISVLFDFDGTLAPIADDPKKAAMTDESRQILLNIAKHPNVFLAIISGRGLKDVQSRVGIRGITYAGNHGLEIEDPDGTRHDFELPMEVRENYTNLVKELNSKVYKNGAWVEDKRVSLTYHYRDVPVEISETQKQEAIRIIEKYGFRANQAVEAVEAKPPVNWHKGEAALFILRKKFGNDWSTQTQIIFAGDDTTDEDAMKALQGVGKTFRVSTDRNVETYADFRLSSQDVVFDLLTWISSAYKV